MLSDMKLHRLRAEGKIQPMLIDIVKLYGLIEDRFGRIFASSLLLLFSIAAAAVAFQIIMHFVASDVVPFVLSLGEYGPLPQGVADYLVVILYSATFAVCVGMAILIPNSVWISRLKRIHSESDTYVQQVKANLDELYKLLPRHFDTLAQYGEELSSIQARLSVLEDAKLTPTSRYEDN